MPMTNSTDVCSIVVKARESDGGASIVNVFHLGQDPLVAPTGTPSPFAITLLTAFRATYRAAILPRLPQTYSVLEYSATAFNNWSLVNGRKIVEPTDEGNLVGDVVLDVGQRPIMGAALHPAFVAVKGRKAVENPRRRARGWVRFGPVPEADTNGPVLAGNVATDWQTAFTALNTQWDADPQPAAVSLWVLGVFRKTAFFLPESSSPLPARDLWSPLKAGALGLVITPELGSQVSRKYQASGN